MKVIQPVIGYIKGKIKFLGGIFALIFYSMVEYFSDRKGRKIINKVLVMQIYFTGNMALKIISVLPDGSAWGPSHMTAEKNKSIPTPPKKTNARKEKIEKLKDIAED